MNTIADDRRFLAISAAVFLASAAGTIYLCRAMSGGMPMPGGWMMSMAWMQMPGQTWLGAAASFLAMWLLMTVAMMVPTLVPSLSSYRHSVGATEPIAIVAAGYFFVWMVFGVAVYPLALIVTRAEMRWRLLAQWVPVATGVVIVLAGCLQLTAWKARQLEACRDSVGCAASAWRHGLRLGVRCALCCSGFMTILLVAGVMDLRAMGLITFALSAERLAPKPEIVARAIGIVIVVTGVVIAGRAAMAA